VQGLPYYERFISAFPTVNHLAKASEEKVLRLWQGLGYYSRARNMHRCAKIIVSDFGGKFPSTFNELIKLPGVGPYTGAAIASIAFNQAHAVVDGNVYRVLARVFGLDDDITSPSGKKLFAEKANELIVPDSPGNFNQAMMEFGATLCTPAKPLCNECPFSRSCVALATQRIETLPVKGKRTSVSKRFISYLIFQYQGKLAMRKRPGQDIWQGLYDFYPVEHARPLSIKLIQKKDPWLKKILKKTEWTEIANTRHILSHQHLHLRFIGVSCFEPTSLPEGLRFYTKRQIEKLPKPIVITRALDKMTW
jgi:A/G-specific adenine glycosylase